MQSPEERAEISTPASSETTPLPSDSPTSPAEDSAPTDSEPELPPLKETVKIDNFEPLDLRVGTVLEAEAVEGTDKLLRLSIDLGLETRQVISGIRQEYSPEELIGKQIVLFANLKPRKIRGTVSQGMVLAADHEGVATLLTPNRPAKNGSAIR